MKKQFKIRAVQLDLARQMETLDFIKEFIDFSSKYGYNTLFLYLEGRIRTKSFPYPSESESYTAKEMKEIVDYADSKGIDVIPGLACLGHAELFLKHEELNKTAELRDGINGRFWNNTKQVFCPSQKATLDFLEKYLTEICEIFPSKYIHIGMDEAWDIGYCETCANKAKTFNGEQKLFLDIVKFCHNVISQKLNRRVMMWDDMFEYYSNILSEIPKDIIMVCWQYQFDVQHIQGHFSNLSVEKNLDKYEHLGINYIIAPATYSTTNIRTFTEFSEKYNPMGALLTNWECSHSYIHKFLPTIAYAGRLWDNKAVATEKYIFATIAKSLFGYHDDFFTALLRYYCEKGIVKEEQLNLNSIMTIPYSGLDYGMKEYFELINISFTNIENKIRTELGKNICRDIRSTTYFHILKFRLKEKSRKLFLTNSSTLKAEEELNDIAIEMDILAKTRVKEWDKFRAGIKPCKYKSLYQNNIKLIHSLPTLAKKHGRLSVRYCLPDQFSAAYCQISLMYNNEWSQVAASSFKCDDSKESFFNIMVLIDKDKIPEAIRFECSGYGGTGIAYIEIINDSGTFIAEKTLTVNGEVINPEFILENDCKWCFVGEKNTIAAFKNRSLAEAKHSVIYKLKEN